MKRIIALLLALVLFGACLPQIPLKADAVIWIDDRNDVDGHDFTKSEKLADKLNSIFDGNAGIYKNSKCTILVDTRIGNSTVPNNGVIQYIGPYGGPYLDAGTSCWIYANGVYYTLFGESTSAGIAGPNSEKLNIYKTNTTYATYKNFKAWGVRNGVGALIRGNNHSMIVMGYDEETLTILDGNGDRQGLISLRIRKWSEVNIPVDYIIQPKEDFYNAMYPGCEHIDSNGNSLFTDKGTDCGFCAKCDYEFDWKRRFDPADSGMYAPAGEPYELRKTPYANAERSGQLLFANQKNWEVLGSFTNAYGEKWYGVGTDMDDLLFAPADAVRYVEAAPLRVTCSNFSPADGITIPKATYNVEGTVTATNAPLRSINAYLDGTLYATWTAPNSSTMSVSLKDTVINHSLRFSALSDGEHSIILEAYGYGSDTPVRFHSSIFYVGSAPASKKFEITCTDFFPGHHAVLQKQTYNLSGTVYSATHYIRRIEGYLDGVNYATWTTPYTIDLVYLKDTVLNMNLKFRELAYGKHTITLKAYNITGECVTFADNVFYVCNASTHTVGETNVEHFPDGGCGSTYSVTRCAVCTAEISRTPVVSEQGHTIQIIPGKAPTCTEPGWTDGKGCSECGITLALRMELPARGHNWTDASCVDSSKCSNCGLTAGVATGHKYNAGVITKQPTCTQSGVRTYTCSLCGGTKTESVSATGHKYDAGAITKQPTCTDEGVRTYTCSLCNGTRTEKISATGHDEVTVPGKAPTTKEPGLTDGTKCSKCNAILVEQQEIPATGHTYDHDFDTDCNICGYIRKIEGVFRFENYRVVFSDVNEMHKNIRAVVYKLGDKTVADPTDESVLLTIDPNASTRWGVGDINKILLTDAGNYVVLLKYNVGTAVVRVPMVVSVSADPKLIIDKNNKLTILDSNEANINHRVVVYYLGDKTVENIYDESALLEVDNAPRTIWQKTRINRLALTKGGNYVLHLCYNVGNGAKVTVAQQFTVFAIPSLSVSNNMLVATEENDENRNHRVTVFYLGDGLVEDPFDEAEVQSAALSSKTYWGLEAINKAELTRGGNYVIHLYYNVGTSEKRTLALELMVSERPQLSMNGNQLVVSYTDPAINNPRAYIYKVGDAPVADIYDEAALQAIANPTTAWGLNEIQRKTLTPGTYVIHFHYNVGTGAKQTVALKVTI